MKEYYLTGEVLISVYTTVKANSLQESIEIANERDIEAYQYGITKQSHTTWVNEEYDGEVVNIKNED